MLSDVKYFTNVFIYIGFYFFFVQTWLMSYVSCPMYAYSGELAPYNQGGGCWWVGGWVLNWHHTTRGGGCWWVGVGGC